MINCLFIVQIKQTNNKYILNFYHFKNNRYSLFKQFNLIIHMGIKIKIRLFVLNFKSP